MQTSAFIFIYFFKGVNANLSWSSICHSHHLLYQPVPLPSLNPEAEKFTFPFVQSAAAGRVIRSLKKKAQAAAAAKPLDKLKLLSIAFVNKPVSCLPTALPTLI